MILLFCVSSYELPELNPLNVIDIDIDIHHRSIIIHGWTTNPHNGTEHVFDVCLIEHFN